MALTITNSEFTKEGFILNGLTSVYIETKATFPVNSFNVFVGLYVYTDTTKTLQVKNIDNLEDVVIDLLPDIEGGVNYWTGINNELIHNKIIAQLEVRNPEWLNKITKVVPNIS